MINLGAMKTISTGVPVHGVIMCGGGGTRLMNGLKGHMGQVPAAYRGNLEKQFLPLLEPTQSMLASTAGRLTGNHDGSPILSDSQRLWFATGDRMVGKIQADLGLSNSRQIIGEPARKNTFPPMATMAKIIAEKDPGAVIVTLPSDHLVFSAQQFVADIRTAVGVAVETGGLVTFGITPTGPSSQYGYIKQGEPLDSEGKVNTVAQFTEKPDASTAQTWLNEGGYLWNSGMFVWQASSFLDKISQFQPGIYALLNSIYGGNAINHNDPAQVIQLGAMSAFFYANNPSKNSVDYKIMEPASQTGDVKVVRAGFQWRDLGSWEEIQGAIGEGEIQPASWLASISESL